MAQRLTIKPTGPGAPSSVPAPGAVSSVGPRPKALPKNPTGATPKNTRDYGKPQPQTNPFGPNVSGGLLDV